MAGRKPSLAAWQRRRRSVVTVAVVAALELAGALAGLAGHAGDRAPRTSSASAGPSTELGPAAPGALATSPAAEALPAREPSQVGERLAAVLAPRLAPPAPVPSRPRSTAPGPPSTVAGLDAPVTRRAPFSEPYRAALCSDGLYDACTAQPGPDAATGVTRLDVSVTSPAGGLAVGLGSAQAASEVVLLERLTRPARAVVVTVTVLVRSAAVERSVSAVPLVPLPTSAAEISLSAAALHAVCGGNGCFVHDARPLVDLAGPLTRSGEQFVLQLRLENPSGPVPAGELAISAGVYGLAQLGSNVTGTELPDVGTVRAAVDAVVTSVTVTPVGS